MLIEGIGYFALVLLLEYLSTFLILLSKLGFVTNKHLTEMDSELDIDVLEEKNRIKSAIPLVGQCVHCELAHWQSIAVSEVCGLLPSV